MLLVLEWLVRQPEWHGAAVFIEEPETHLFPTTQRQLVEALVGYRNRSDLGLLVTTHSPYVLTAMNNLIMAQNVIEERGEEATAAVLKVIGGNRALRYVDVSAYTVDDGTATSIMDDEVKLIGSSVIDDVSDDFEAVYGRLVDMRYP